MSDKALKAVKEVATQLALLTHPTRSTPEQAGLVMDMIGPTLATLCDIYGIDDADIHHAMRVGKRAHLAMD